jgi:hypothetical protein
MHMGPLARWSGNDNLLVRRVAMYRMKKRNNVLMKRRKFAKD